MKKFALVVLILLAGAGIWYASHVTGPGLSLRASFSNDWRTTNELGRRHFTGQGASHDPAKGVELARKAVELSGRNPAAVNNLASMLAIGGPGFAPNPVAAIELHREAANADFAPALNSLGTMYMEGSGVLRVPKTGFALMKESALQGFAPAQYNLALNLSSPRSGIRNNLVEAQAWAMLSAEANNPGAAELVERLRHRLGPADQRRAEKRLEEIRVPIWQAPQ